MNLNPFKNIFFDIDGTLFDTKAFYSDFYKKIIVQYSLDKQRVLQARETYYKRLSDGTDFNHQDFLKSISDSLNIDVTILNEVFLNQKSFEEHLYPEVRPSMVKLKEKFRLGIFSQGNKDYQMLKLKKTELIKYFDPKLLLIFDRKLTDHALDAVPPLSLIVDDKIEVVELLKKKNFGYILLDRNAQSVQFNPRITSLSELNNTTL